jgi:hypothetical protein
VSGAALSPRLTAEDRPDIRLSDGRVLTPRARLADEIKVNERTLARRDPETVYVGGVAYVDRERTLQDIAQGLKRRNEPPKRRGRPAAGRINKRHHAAAAE